jgi:hypothetical protein
VAGLVAPWHADERRAGDFPLSKFQLREGKGVVEVSERGLYYIYAQVRVNEAEVIHIFCTICAVKFGKKEI